LNAAASSRNRLARRSRADFPLDHTGRTYSRSRLRRRCLLANLAATRQVSGYGLEIDPVNVAPACAPGSTSSRRDLDEGLADFATGSFDFV